MNKGFIFSAKRTDHDRMCMYEGCYYYDPQAKNFCCTACSCDANDSSRLNKEAVDEK